MKRNKGKFIALAVALAVAAALVGYHVERYDPSINYVNVRPFPDDAMAQSGILSVDRNGTSTQGVAIVVWSDTAGIIPDGTIVMADTQSTNGIIKRFSVVPYTGTSINRARCIGVAWGNIPSRSTGAPGKVLIYGYHANAKMGATGMSANTLVKVAAATHGAFTTATDSINMACGIFVSYASNATAANPRGKVILLPGNLTKNASP